MRVFIADGARITSAPFFHANRCSPPNMAAATSYGGLSRHFRNDFADSDADGGGRSVVASSSLIKAGRLLNHDNVREVWDSKTESALPDGLSGEGVYTGLGGVAYSLFHEFQLSRDPASLRCARTLTDACIRSSQAGERRHRRPAPSFLMGPPGLHALAAAMAHAAGDAGAVAEHAALLRAFAAHLGPSAELPCELLYGRAGYLYACLFADAHCGAGTVPASITAPVIADVLAIGRAGAAAVKSTCPLMFEWHGTPYTGAAHGLAGICHVLLHFELAAADRAAVVGTLKYLLSIRFPSGNLPSHDGDDCTPARDKLVHWCHGATGFCLALVHAWEVTGDAELLHGAIEAAEVTWRRGLLKKLSLCHGVAGGCYPFLALRRAALRIVQEGKDDAKGTWAVLAQRCLRRAVSFATFLEYGPDVPATATVASTASDSSSRSAPSEALPVLPFWRYLVQSGQMHGGDAPCSLYEGAAGVAWALMDVGHALAAAATAAKGSAAADGTGAGSASEARLSLTSPVLSCRHTDRGSSFMHTGRYSQTRGAALTKRSNQGRMPPNALVQLVYLAQSVCCLCARAFLRCVSSRSCGRKHIGVMRPYAVNCPQAVVPW
jgi:hypothetical protein